MALGPAHRTLRFGLAAALVGLPHAAVAGQAPATGEPPSPPLPAFGETVEVVGVTPIHGLGIARHKVPGNVQVSTAADLERTSGLDLGEQLRLGFGSVHANETQASSFQPDIQFRGFAASPLLGLPQGIAIYQDGVRVNEPFGDTVNWDLLPANAIAGVNLMPGSNPLFGLNALGGAVSIQTKTGFSNPGHGVRLSGGSWGRRWLDVESGGHSRRLGYFLTGRLLDEDGWREFSPSQIRQVFGNFEYRDARTSLNAAVTASSNTLVGNGPAPAALIAGNRAAVFTHPDETRTRAALVTLTGRRTAGGSAVLEGALYYRPATVGTVNGDDTAYDDCTADDVKAFLCAEDGRGKPIVDQFGRTIAAAGELGATNNSSRTRTRGWGGSLQATVTRPVAGRANHLVAGAGLDGARARYSADTELARLTATRGTAGAGLFDADAAVRLRSTVRHRSVYAADFFTLVPRLTLMGSARYTRSVVRLDDQTGGALSGHHRFGRLNPSAGLTFDVRDAITAYASYSTASRVPTPSELGCADPEDPCRLPNAFVADPPLDQVVARTWEAGVRRQAAALNWTAAAFATTSRHDIIFISSGALTNEGHFANVGDTRRRGLELSGAGTLAQTVRWGAAYTYLRATFDTPLVLSSPNHPDARAGEIPVAAGRSIPGIPRHILKGDLSVTAGRTTAGTSLTWTSAQFLRGDEANLLAPIPGATTVNLAGSYAFGRRARLTARVTNLFGVESATFGLLGDADDVLGEEFDDPRFVSPSAPRAAWMGVELALP